MKLFVLFIFLALNNSNSSRTISKSFLNPTGTYKLSNKTTKRDGDIYGYFGETRIKLLDNTCIAISFYVCKGAPSYNSGSFLDTLSYSNGKAFYTSEDDSTCTITFQFNKNGIDVTQRQDELNFGCGFGHGVFADGYYKRISKRVPEITDLLTELVTIFQLPNLVASHFRI